MKQLNELSKDTLRNYIPKAQVSAVKHRKMAHSFKQTALDEPRKNWGKYSPVNSKRIMRWAKQHDEFANKREENVSRAKSRLKEDAVPVNNIGSGAVQGAGTGKYPESEPGVPRGKKRLMVILNNAKMLTRKV